MKLPKCYEMFKLHIGLESIIHFANVALHQFVYEMVETVLIGFVCFLFDVTN